MKTANDFQNFFCKVWFGPKSLGTVGQFVVPTLGLVGEAGEVADKMKKHFRGDGQLNCFDTALEVSDVIFYAAILADRLGYTLQEVMQMQVDKINGRIERGTRRGEGDSR